MGDFLQKKVYQNSVFVDGKFYRIHTSSHYWFRFSELIDKKDVSYADFNFLYEDTIPSDIVKGFHALLDFYYKEKELPRKIYATSCEKILDYTIDAELIYAAILEQYHIDIKENEYHWHKVRTLIEGLHGTKLNDIMECRSYRGNPKDAGYRECMRLKNMWALPDRDDDVLGEDDELTSDDMQMLLS